MSDVVQLAPRVDDRPAPSDRDLLLKAINLIVSLTNHVAEQAARIAALESRVPPPPFEVPAGWLMAKQAAPLCGYAASTLYRWVRQGKIVGGPHGGNVYIDPTSLPVKDLSVSELTTEIK